MAVSQRPGDTDGWHIATFGHFGFQFALLNGQQAPLHLGPGIQCRRIDSFQGRNIRHYPALGHCNRLNVKRRGSRQFQELLQLHFGLSNLSTHVHHVVVPLAHLCQQLCQVRLGQTSRFHHHFSAFADDGILREQSAVHPFGLLHIQYLHIELGYLFLDAVGRSLRVEGRHFRVKIGIGDGHLCFATVPHHPLGIDAVAAALHRLVNRRSGNAAIHIVAPCFLKRSVSEPLGQRSAQ